MYRDFFKRIIDFTLALVGMVLLLPIFLTVTVFLYVANSGKPFFFQQRPGLHNKIFRIVKFRTMNDKRDADGKLLPDPERLTKVGAFVRKTSLDEIPQLLNVIRGDMSLIGPRPLLVEYLPHYTQTESRRHEVRPGITGWAQVNGRNTISWDQKFAYDVWYVDHLSLWIDLKIILLTIKNVLTSSGVSADGHISMPNLLEDKKIIR